MPFSDVINWTVKILIHMLLAFEFVHVKSLFKTRLTFQSFKVEPIKLIVLALIKTALIRRSYIVIFLNLK